MLHHAQKKIDIQTSFMGLINDYRIIGAQETIMLCLGKQYAIGHEFDSGSLSGAVLKTNFMANDIACRAQLFPDSGRNRGCRYTSRLGTADQPFPAPSGLKTHLWQLGGLTASGITGNNHDLMGAKSCNNLFFLCHNRQRFRVGRFNHEEIMEGED